jgi:hypothetical protein
VAQALAERLRRPTYTADTTAAAVEALARSGIGTYLEPLAASPELPVTGAVSPLRLLDFQVHALAVDAWAGSGLSGSELDALLPIPAEIHDQTAPAAAFLAAYVAAVDSHGAALARALMADQDLTQPQALHFPLIVLHLFVSDLATDGGQRTGAIPGSGPAAIEAVAFRPPAAVVGGSGQAGLATLCSDAATFIDNTIHALFNLLKVAVPDNTVGAIVATLWNWIVDQGEAFVRGLISAVTDAVLATVRAIAGGIASIASEVAGMVPYVVRVRVDPIATIDLGSTRVSGEFVATVTAGDLPDWPDVMKDCAAKAQVALPSFRGRDEPVTWGTPRSDAPGIISFLRSDPRTDGEGEARWVFGTGPDPGEAPGAQRNSVVYLDVTIHRSALDDARKSLSNALFGGIPKILRGFVDELFGFFVDPLQTAVAALIDTHATGLATIVYHDSPTATPSPSVAPTTTPPPSDICALLSDQEVTAVIGVPVARREGTGSIQAGGGCVIGTVRQTDLKNAYYANIIIEPRGTIFPQAQAQAGVQDVAGVGEQAVFFPQAGAIIGVVGKYDFSLQVVIAGSVGSVENALGLAKLVVSRL